MPNDDAQARARSRAKAKLLFQNHAIVYAAVMAFLLIINLVTSSSYLWVVWPALGWGFALALHGALVMLGMGESERLERMTERELEREKGQP